MSRNKSEGTSILDSLLPCARVDKDLKRLYVFGITSQDRMVESRGQINRLQFGGLIGECYHLFDFCAKAALWLLYDVLVSDGFGQCNF